MFGLIKNILKEKEITVETIKLSDLHAGCVIGFGFMPQKNISGLRLPVTEANSYLFDDNNFVSYRLEKDGIDINLIVADGDDAGTYLALSQRVEDRMFETVFSSMLPQYWFALKEGEKVQVDDRAVGTPLGWLTTDYALAMSARGRILEGDFRLRKPADRVRLSREFDYVLLVDEENDYALEVEKYEDGTLVVYATVYRPASDIGEITRSVGGIRITPENEQKSFIAKVEIPTIEVVSSVEKAPEAKIVTEPETAHEAQPVPDLKEPDLKIITEQVNASATTNLPETNNAPEIKTPSESATEIVSGMTEIISQPVHGKFGRIQPSASSAQDSMDDMLVCNTKLAGRIINEALRSQMPLSELIRKVIDLPAQTTDQVLIPFLLTDSEYAEIARRYNLPPSDHEAVKKQVLIELQNFAGEKK